MSGSRHNYLTPSELLGAPRGREPDRRLPNGVSTSMQHRNSDFSVHAAVLQAEQRSTGIESATHAAVGEESFSNSIGGANHVVVSEPSSLESRLSKLVTTSALALQIYSLGRLNQRESDHRTFCDEAMVVSYRGSGKKKQFFSRSFYTINKKLNKLKMSKLNSEIHLTELAKKYKKAKKIIEKNPSQNWINKKRLKNVVAKLKKEQRVVRKNIYNLDKKYKSANKLLNEMSLSDSRKNKVKNVFKNIRSLQKVNKKPHKIFIFAQPSFELSIINTIPKVARNKKVSLKGGGYDLLTGTNTNISGDSQNNFFPLRNSFTSEGKKEKEENLRYSENLLRQGNIKYETPSPDKENVQTSNHNNDFEARNNITIIKDESKKDFIIKLLRDFFVKSHKATQEQGENFESSLRERSANSVMCVASITKENILSESVDPRFSGLKIMSKVYNEETITKHIRENCALEEILETEIEGEGDILLLKAQRAENPFSMAYDNGPNHEHLPVDKFLRATATGANFFYNIITIGIKPFISNLVANYYRRQYFKLKNDSICAAREGHLSVAEFATIADAIGLTFKSVIKPSSKVGGRMPFKKPEELRFIKPLPDKSAYVAKNKKTGILQEVIIKIKNNNKAPDKIVDNGREILLKQKGKKNEFVTHHPDVVNPELLERRVIVDEKTGTWRYADQFISETLNVELYEGKNFIRLHGEQYELHMKHNQYYEIVAHHTSGTTSYIPVYMDQLSKTWHLKTHNKKPVFSNNQQRIIDRLKVKREQDKSYHANYLKGRVFEVKDINKDIYTNPSLYSVVEMNGNLVPVKIEAFAKHGLKHKIYNIHHKNEKPYSIEWDGNRWIFEIKTSRHVSKRLKNIVTEKMFDKKIDVNKLSSEDHMGLRFDVHDNRFLKIKNEFVRIHSSKHIKNNFYIKSNDGMININYSTKKNKFELESLSQRLNKLKQIGLSGDPVKIVEQSLGKTPKEAEKFLSGYQFSGSQESLENAFILEIKNTNTVPEWSDIFKIVPEKSGPYTLPEYIYRADSASLDQIKKHGFSPSSDFGAVKNLYGKKDGTLICAMKLEGAIRYQQGVENLVHSHHVYKIPTKDITTNHVVDGVSLKQEFIYNRENLKKTLKVTDEKPFKTFYELGNAANGANYLEEAHVSLGAVNKLIDKVELVPVEELLKASDIIISRRNGPWNDELSPLHTLEDLRKIYKDNLDRANGKKINNHNNDYVDIGDLP